MKSCHQIRGSRSADVLTDALTARFNFLSFKSVKLSTEAEMIEDIKWVPDTECRVPRRKNKGVSLALGTQKSHQKTSKPEKKNQVLGKWNREPNY